MQSAPQCAKWCLKYSQPWTIKCAFLKCSGCDGCVSSSSATQRRCPVDSVREPTLTMCCRKDGFGSQYMALISVYTFAAFTNRTFCASPFHAVGHFTKRGRVVALDAQDLHNFVGGPSFGPIAAPTTPTKFSAAPELLSNPAPGAVPYHQVADLARRYYDAAGRKPALYHFQRGRYNVVLHLRAGDVTPGGTLHALQELNNRSKWTPSARVASCVRTVMQRAPQSAVLHVFSQGNLSEFGFLERWKPVLHVEAPTNAAIARADTASVTASIKSVFHHMVEADSLIIARSSLSIAAGFLSKGRVFSTDLACSAAGKCTSTHSWNAILQNLEPCV